MLIRGFLSLPVPVVVKLIGWANCAGPFGVMVPARGAGSVASAAGASARDASRTARKCRITTWSLRQEPARSDFDESPARRVLAGPTERNPDPGIVPVDPGLEPVAARLGVALPAQR